MEHYLGNLVPFCPLGEALATAYKPHNNKLFLFTFHLKRSITYIILLTSTHISMLLFSCCQHLNSEQNIESGKRIRKMKMISIWKNLVFHIFFLVFAFSLFSYPRFLLTKVSHSAVSFQFSISFLFLLLCISFVDKPFIFCLRYLGPMNAPVTKKFDRIGFCLKLSSSTRVHQKALSASKICLFKKHYPNQTNEASSVVYISLF